MRKDWWKIEINSMMDLIGTIVVLSIIGTIILILIMFCIGAIK